MAKNPPKRKATLESIAASLRSLKSDLKRIEEKGDDRFALTKREFQALRGDAAEMRVEMRKGFSEVRRDIDTLARQLGQTVTDVGDLKKRARKSPSA